MSNAEDVGGGVASYNRSEKDAGSFVEHLATCYDDAMIMENEASNITDLDDILESSEFDFLEKLQSQFPNRKSP